MASRPYKITRAPFGVAPLQMQFKDWFFLPVNPDTFEDYRQSAKKILDACSQEMNPVGIQMLLAAMIDLTESGYNGTHNNRPGSYTEKTSNQVLDEVE